jgi:hypothetical protein
MRRDGDKVARSGILNREPRSGPLRPRRETFGLEK